MRYKVQLKLVWGFFVGKIKVKPFLEQIHQFPASPDHVSLLSCETSLLQMYCNITLSSLAAQTWR